MATDNETLDELIERLAVAGAEMGSVGGLLIAIRERAMLTVKAAAGRAGVCPAIVYGWVSSGELTHFRLGAKGRRGKIVIAEADLDAFLQERRLGGRPGPPPAPRPAAPARLTHLRAGPS